jgi:Raf kinase inhibitor-like YbhB/YbcL family protein
LKAIRYNLAKAFARGLFVALISLAVGGTGVQAFELSSPDLLPDKPMANTFVFNGFDCHGDNISPALQWKDPPPNTKSFALMVHDPDAVTGGAGIWHWVVVDMPAASSGLSQGVGTRDGSRLPLGARQVTTDYDVPGWGGPCPPKGQPAHTYNFTLYALGVEKLDFPPNATASHVGFLVNRNSLGQARLSVRYGRP